MRFRDIYVEEPKFSQNTVTFHFLLIDRSGSMGGRKENSVKNGLELIKNELLKLEDTSSTRVSLIEFGDLVYPSNLKKVETFDISYYARNEKTALYAAICYVENQVAKLFDQYREKYRLNVNVLVLSDGRDYSIYSSYEEAKKAVQTLKEKYKTSTIFYAIESEDEMEGVTQIAHELGFDVKRMDENTSTVDAWGNEVSTMLVSSSRSGIPAQLSGLSTTLESSISKVAAEKFGASVGAIQEDFVDPFEEFL